MINVSCAIIVNNKGEVLVTQRSASMKLPLKWEFPGGKVEQYETAKECLIREIKEELNIELIITNALSPVEHHYQEFSIRLIPFTCVIKSGEISLAEHIAYQWLLHDALLQLDWAAADVPVLANYLKTRT